MKLNFSIPIIVLILLIAACSNNSDQSSQNYELPDDMDYDDIAENKQPAKFTILIADSFFNRVTEVDSNGKIVWQYGTEGNTLNNPSSVQRLENGNTLIADTYNYRIIEIDKAGSIIWQYGNKVKGSGDNQLNNPEFAIRLDDGNTLIADSGNRRVIEVDTNNKIVWRYGVIWDIYPPQNPELLHYPYSVQRLDNGNTLIADSRNQQVIEVTSDKKIVWKYSTQDREQVKTFGAHREKILTKFAQRLANGNTLIVEGIGPNSNSTSKRVLELNYKNEVVWDYVSDNYGLKPSEKFNPYSAQRLENGNTLIVDQGNGRILEVNSEKKIVWSYGANENEAPKLFNPKFAQKIE